MEKRAFSKSGITLEICANSSTSAALAQAGGAHRVELCQNLDQGGTTPSYGQIKRTRELLTIGVYVLIRPRTGGFVYSAAELEEMQADIRCCKELGCEGVVLGVLTTDGSVDGPAMAALMREAHPMEVVFHRAFDMVSNAEQALEDIIALGCVRILTSGLRHTALEGQETIARLIRQAQGRIEIMPGAGIDADNICTILAHTGARSVHSSAKETLLAEDIFVNNNLQGMNEPQLQTSLARVVALVEQLHAYHAE